MKIKQTTKERDVKELDRAIKALQATGHNPIDWAPIIRFVAPIIARIAARYVMKLVSQKLHKSISSKIREETVIAAADHLSNIAIARTTKVKK